MHDRLKYGLLLQILTAFTFISCESTDDATPDDSGRDKYLGTWNGETDGPIGGQINFTTEITASNTADDQIVMENFDGYGQSTYVVATVDGSTMTIPRNIIGSDTIQGSGSYRSNGTLSFTFTVRDGQNVDYRTGTASR